MCQSAHQYKIIKRLVTKTSPPLWYCRGKHKQAYDNTAYVINKYKLSGT